jgi:hypothetical protein
MLVPSTRPAQSCDHGIVSDASTVKQLEILGNTKDEESADARSGDRHAFRRVHGISISWRNSFSVLSLPEIYLVTSVSSAKQFSCVHQSKSDKALAAFCNRIAHCVLMRSRLCGIASGSRSAPCPRHGNTLFVMLRSVWTLVVVSDVDRTVRAAGQIRVVHSGARSREPPGGVDQATVPRHQRAAELQRLQQVA